MSASSILAFQDDAPLTIDEIDKRLKAIEESPDEDKALVEIYSRALASLKAAGEAGKQAADDRMEASKAPALLESLRSELSKPSPYSDPEIDPNLSLDDVEAALKQAEAELSAARAEADQLDKFATSRAARKAALPGEMTSAQEVLSKAQEAFDSTPSEGLLSEPSRISLRAQVEEHKAVLDQLQAERDLYEAEQELLTLRRERANQVIALRQKVAEFWGQVVNERRGAEGEAAALEATGRLLSIRQKFPVLEPLAQSVHELASMRTGESGLPRQISLAQEDRAATQTVLDETRRRRRSAQLRIEAGGLTEDMGILLRRDLEWLPRRAKLRLDIETHEQELSKALLQLIEVEEALTREGDIGAELTLFLTEEKVSDPSRELLECGRDLIQLRREARRALENDLAILVSIYYERKDVMGQLSNEANSYRDLIEQNILWVRSAAQNPFESFRSLPIHTTLVAGAIRDASLGDRLWSATQQWFLSCFLIVAFVLSLLAGRRFLCRKRVEMGALVRSYRTDSYVFTVRAIIQTLLLALPFPMLVWLIGWLLSDVPEELGRAVGYGLRETAKAWLVLQFVRGLLVEKGVGQVHFKWPQSSLEVGRRELRWFPPLVLSFGFVALTLHRHSQTEWSDSLGRLCFLGEMIAVSVFSRRLLCPESKIWLIASSSDQGLLGKTRRFWTLLITLLPIALGVAALLGYYYTTLQFELRLRYTLGFAICVVLVNALLLRWLFMTRRRLAVKQALEARAKKAEDQDASPVTESAAQTFDVDRIDIPAVDAQTRQLFKSSITLTSLIGMYLIWSAVLPALQGLDRIQLLPKFAIAPAESQLQAEVVGEPPSVETPRSSDGLSGMNVIPVIPTVQPTGEGAGLPTVLTLADILLALLFLLFTVIAVKNLPALLELAVLQRLPLDHGARYAVSTIVRYMVLLVGIGAISGALGIGWQKVQWLAAALTFGLAFGLQEIFANFVSGVIILLERPIRVGDIVTVAGTEGRVTRLRMRATTIQDWDRRELLIPNKEFITGNVTNWTLTDPVTRVVIPVGIAYGSDTAKARNLLLRAAKANSIVLEEPSPQAIFRNFGESSLDFELRVFIANRDYWPKVVDQLHTQIDDAFRAANIEIAFPQRDIHIRKEDPTGDSKPL